MAKQRLVLKQKREPKLSTGERSYLLTGFDIDGGDEGARRNWELHKGALMKEWFSGPENLGKRPFAWWEFSRPTNELRRCISGWPPIAGSPIYLGYRSHWVDKRTVIEPEVFYLERHGLLTREERRDVVTLKEKARSDLEERSRGRGCADPGTWNWEGLKGDQDEIA